MSETEADWVEFTRSIMAASDIRPAAEQYVVEHADLFEVEARNMIRNGESRDVEHWVEHGKAFAAIVLAARWWAQDWRENQRRADAFEQVRSWAAKNEIADVPLDWAGLGEILQTVAPD